MNFLKNKKPIQLKILLIFIIVLNLIFIAYIKIQGLSIKKININFKTLRNK